MTFETMGLPDVLAASLQHMGFKEPTPIQLEAIPPALEGRDILGSAQTGTGKTAAFGIPLVAHLLANPRSTALVMTPTRELATQVRTQLLAMLGKGTKIKSALLIGGDSMYKQLQHLRTRPRLIVGTPGRINDHLKRKSLDLSHTDFLVLDETDRMLDMGFTVQIEAILDYMPVQRQTLLFSATLPKNIVRIAEKYLDTPLRVAASETSEPAANIDQEVLRISEAEKYGRLLEALEARDGSIIIFIKTKYGTEKMATRLSGAGYEAEAIHGDLRQRQRDKVIAAFRKKRYRILVATDVAARGLDIPHIEHVINYDLPQCAEDYIHRIGRTARAGAKGAALNLVTPADRGKWAAILRLIDPEKAEQERTRERKNDRSPGRKRNFKGKKPFGNAKSFKDKGAKDSNFDAKDSRDKVTEIKRERGAKPKKAFGNKEKPVFAHKPRKPRAKKAA